MEDLSKFTDILSRCYPGMKLTSEEEKKKFTENREEKDKEPSIEHFGVYDGETQVGGSVHYLLPMNVYQKRMHTRGIGTLGVDLPYKKLGVAKKMIQHFITEAKNDGYPLVHLYPFKPHFYRQMGFGFGPQLNVFQLAPSQFPSFDEAPNYTPLQKEDKEEIMRCYHEWSETTHGALEKQAYEFRHVEMENTHVIGCRINNKLLGYMIYQFNQKENDNFLQHDLHITDWVAHTPDAFRSLIRFLHNQKDQVRSVVFPTFNDEFVYLLDDPTHQSNDLIFRIYHETHRRGTGAMYRIVNIPKFIESIHDHSFSDESVIIDFEVKDSLMEQETYKYTCEFNSKGTQLVEAGQSSVHVSLDIADFSSLLMGCVTLENLIFIGKAEAKGEVDRAKRVFSAPEKPENWTFI